MEQLPRAVPSKWQVKLLDTDATTVEALVRRLERLKTVNISIRKCQRRRRVQIVQK